MVCSWCSIRASCGHFGSISPALPGLMNKYMYILVGTSVAVLLCLLLLVLLLVRRRRQRKHGRSQGEGGATWEGCLGCWGDGLPPNPHPDCPQSPSTAKARSRGPRRGEDPQNDPQSPSQFSASRPHLPHPTPSAPPMLTCSFSSGSTQQLTSQRAPQVRDKEREPLGEREPGIEYH